MRPKRAKDRVIASLCLSAASSVKGNKASNGPSLFKLEYFLMLCDHFKKKTTSIAEKSCHITKFLARYEKIASSSELCTLFIFVL